MELAPTIVAVYAFLAGALLGWTTPRGRHLKQLQKRIIQGLARLYE